MTALPDITADAIALQERDEFRAAGWLKTLAPAKVNLFLAVGPKMPNGYHQVATIMHSLTLHDTVYLRRKLPNDEAYGTGTPSISMVQGADFPPPPVAPEDNLALKAVQAFIQAFHLDESQADVRIRIEKSIPSQAGLGGASSDAAAVLQAMAALTGCGNDDGALDEVACSLGADVAFFLHGGCAYLEGAGDRFVHDLVPSKRTLVLVKPQGGVATSEAYRAFDECPAPVPEGIAAAARIAEDADEVPLFNNLAPAAERLLPALGTVRHWLSSQPAVEECLLTGSGATTFGICHDFAGACQIVAEARKQGWWARTASLSSAKAVCMGDGGVR